MTRRRITHAIMLAALVAACAGNDLDPLAPKLVVSPAAPIDPVSGHYLIDFGTVSIGVSETKILSTSNLGRSTLRLQPLQVSSPFSSDLTAVEDVGVSDDYGIAFTFTPLVDGQDEATVNITSDGGDATVVLRGTGTNVPTSTCSFTVMPASIDFGTGSVGQAKTSVIHVTNAGSGDCLVSQLELSPTSDPSFSLPGAQVPPFTVSTGAAASIVVQFLPTQAGPSFTGDVLVTVGAPGAAGTPGKVPLSASAIQGPSCTATVAPPSVDFGNIASGDTATRTIEILNTGTVDCQLTQLSLTAGSSAAFALPHPPALPATITPANRLQISVAFTPPQPAPTFTGSVLLDVGMTASVPLTAASPTTCLDPQADGSCTPPATATVYLNDQTTLYSYDITTSKFNAIGDFSGSLNAMSMYDIAVDSTGVMAGVSNGALYLIDPTTAACSHLAIPPDSTANGLTFTPSGLLVVAGVEIDVYDRSTGKFTNLVPQGQYQTSGDIVGLPNGLLYWTVVGPNGPDLLVTVDPTSGATTEIGSTGQENIWGMSYANDILYGFTEGGQVLQMDTTTAASSVMTIGGNWYGAATNPATWP